MRVTITERSEANKKKKSNNDTVANYDNRICDQKRAEKKNLPAHSFPQGAN